MDEKMRLRGKKNFRVRYKRDENGSPAPATRKRYRHVDERAVPEMETVEIPNREDRRGRSNM